MTEKAVVTVIVPFKNAVKYLPRLITNLKQQTLHCFEVLLVDNGSVDSSASVASRYIRDDKRFSLISALHGGVSAARNRGLDEVKTEFVTFIDVDDFVSDTHLETLVKGISGKDIDVSVVGFQYIDNGTVLLKSNYKRGQISSENAIRSVFGLKGLQGFVCNKIFKMSIIKNHSIEFDNHFTRYEDLNFVIEYLTKVKSVFVDNAVTYIYEKHTNSSLQNLSVGSLDQDLDAVRSVEQSISSCGMSDLVVEKAIAEMKSEILITYFMRGNKDQKKKAKRLFTQCWSWHMAITSTSFKHFIKLLVVRIWTLV